MNDFTIRTARPEDAPALLDIYAPYVLNTAITFEYSVPSVGEFTDRIRKTLEQYPYLVAENRAGQPVGYAYAGAFKSRAAYDWSVETSIYVGGNEHRHGLGRLLYTQLEDCLRRQNVLNLNACIAYAREDNTNLDNGSMFFHEKMGYALVGTFHRCGYKFGQWYDMIWMEKMLGDHTPDVAPFIPFPQLSQ